MPYNIRRIQKISVLTILLLLLQLPSAESLAQNTIHLDSLNLLKYPGYIIDYTQKGIKYTDSIIDKYLDGNDIRYKTPNLFVWRFMLQYSNYYEYYKFSARNNPQSFTLSPDNSNKLGLYVGWKWIFLGWSFNLDRDNTSKDWNFSFYTAKVGIDVFHRNTGENFKLRKLSGFKNPVSGDNLVPQQQLFSGIAVKQTGMNVYYIFNNEEFSYPAAYSQSTNQRISCGSFILGASYSQQSFRMDVTKFDNNIRETMHPSLNFNHIEYHDYSINAGYTYNWVFAKNCLANISLTPALGYKYSCVKSEENQSIFNNINVDLVSRAALVYNNTRWYAGVSLVSHTYTYRKSALSIINGFGVVNVYSGINLFRKKEEKK
jgi:hypothetical protein